MNISSWIVAEFLINHQLNYPKKRKENLKNTNISIWCYTVMQLEPFYGTIQDDTDVIIQNIFQKLRRPSSCSFFLS